MVSFLSCLFVLKICTRSRLTLAAPLTSRSSTKSDRCEDNGWQECQAANTCRWSSGNGCVDNVSSLHVLFLMTLVYTLMSYTSLSIIERRRCSLQWKGLEGKSIYIISGIYVSRVLSMLTSRVCISLIDL